MTKSEAVKRAYNWAWNTQNDKHSPTMAILCANQVSAAVQDYGDTPEACYEVLANLVQDWKSQKRAGFEASITTVGKILSTVDQQPTQTAQ